MHQDNRYKKQGLARFIQAFVNSGKGFASVWLNESAFRQEVYLLIFLSMIALFLPISINDKFVLILCIFPVLIVELINSAIESTVDRISMEKHDLSGRAKDMASAAVLISLLIVLCVWCFILWKNFNVFFNNLICNIWLCNTL
ncbi:diacylglycerol kinase [Woeseiaceae bacterium]|jgi:diacylglycerol kinase (ATP)|nr:diacylglycerol kinase [Woeseiaceae bacterium]MDB2543672.1 diacylglycerol kinase [Woeseiaceae bacterium]|tara:strand:- start:1913 stop:2341 length:429 start_codon:yes stop_codon:yes gene_type:complete